MLFQHWWPPHMQDVTVIVRAITVRALVNYAVTTTFSAFCTFSRPSPDALAE